MHTRPHIAIIGAGAAGLAAALAACEAGSAPLVFEARNRVGGRAWTADFPVAGLSAEIGPEFIHGLPETTLSYLARFGIARYEIGGESQRFVDGRLLRETEPEDDAAEAYFYQALDALPPSLDLPLADFFASLPDDARHPEHEYEILRMANGFDAAHPAIAGVRGLAAEWRGDASPAGSASKPLGGYRTLMRSLAAEITARQGRIQLNTHVVAIEQTTNGYILRTTGNGGSQTHTVQGIILTLPLPLLQRSCMVAAPTDDNAQLVPYMECNVPLAPSIQAALTRRAMGHVIKPVLRFNTAFWEDLADGEFRTTSFFRSAPGVPFPVFWTQLPFHYPLLTFWAGGADADAAVFRTLPAPVDVCPQSGAEYLTDQRHPLLQAAFTTLAQTFGIDAQPYFCDALFVNWQADIFSRGAYSYAAPYALDDAAALREPLAPHIYLAGEAFAPLGETGTVAGAAASGRIALERLLQSFT